MVQLSIVKERNEAFAADRSQSSGLVAVFMGATSGIGASTLTAVTSLLQDSTIYVLGRSLAKFAPQKEKLAAANASNKIVFVEADVSLLSEVDKASKLIAGQAGRVDLLYMSPGLVPLGGAEYTAEGLELSFVLSYYARARLVDNLALSLAASAHPRILSVLNAGKEKPVDEDDLGLQKDEGKGWSGFAAMNHETVLNTLFLESTAAGATPAQTCMHAFPGLVQTNIFDKIHAPASSGFLWTLAVAGLRRVLGLIMYLQGVTPEESGERQAYHLTNAAAFGPGSSVHLIDEHSEEVAPNAVVVDYKERGLPSKAYGHTQQVFEKVASKGLIANESGD